MSDILREQTLQQLGKDLGTEWDFPGAEGWAYADLRQYTATLLEKKFQRDPGGFMQWMYRIDIPEQDLRRLLKTADTFSELAEWVIKREFLKVLLRNKYKIEDLPDMPDLLS